MICEPRISRRALAHGLTTTSVDGFSHREQQRFSFVQPHASAWRLIGSTKTTKFLAVIALLLITTTACAHPEIPGARQTKPIAIVGATIHTAVGPAIENGVVLFESGKITAVGKNVKIPEGAIEIQAKGKHVYPGLIESSSNLGLIEINAVRATRDYAETGDLNPNVRAETAFNPDSELIPVTRANGVLMCVTTPSGGLISGRAAVMQLDGWTWSDMTIKGNAALQINWPRMRPTDDGKTPARLQKLEDFFQAARDYRAARNADATLARDIRLESLLPVMDGEFPIVASADGRAKIESAVAFAKRHSLKLIIRGGYDAEKCATLLKANKVPVIIGGVHRVPLRRSDVYDAPFTLASRLQKAGVEFCIAGSSRFGGSNVRNLPYHAATAVAYGLSPEEALQAITIAPAKIFGIENRIGSLETNKDATLFISDGDIFAAETHVEQAWIQGREVSLNNRHKRLWKKYETKYDR